MRGHCKEDTRLSSAPPILSPQTGDAQTELLRDGEIDNCWVLFHKEVVLGESFDAKDEVRRQFGELEPFQKILLVGFVFLSVNAENRMFFIVDKSLQRCCDSTHGFVFRVEGAHLLRAAIELVEDVEQRNLWDDELLLLVLVQRGCREVKGQKQEGGLGHLLLILVGNKQSLLFFWRLQVDRNFVGCASSQLKKTF